MNRIRNELNKIKRNIKSLDDFEFRLKKVWKILIKQVGLRKLTLSLVEYIVDENLLSVQGDPNLKIYLIQSL